MELIEGKKYHVDQDFISECYFVNENGIQIDAPRGYNLWDYFSNGEYLGEDIYGVGVANE